MINLVEKHWNYINLGGGLWFYARGFVLFWG